MWYNKIKERSNIMDKDLIEIIYLVIIVIIYTIIFYLLKRNNKRKSQIDKKDYTLIKDFTSPKNIYKCLKIANIIIQKNIT